MVCFFGGAWRVEWVHCTREKEWKIMSRIACDGLRYEKVEVGCVCEHLLFQDALQYEDKGTCMDRRSACAS